jgi:TonB family protein
MPKAVHCGQFEDLAILYSLGELEPDDRAAVEEHARLCAGCAGILRREAELNALLAPSAPADAEPSDLLLARCRHDLARALDEDSRAARRRMWRSLFSPRAWAASLRISPRMHPAWSVAALVIVGGISGLAGWEGIGRAPLQPPGPTVLTVSAAPPPPVASPAAPAASSPQAATAPTAHSPSVEGPDERVYWATGAGMNSGGSDDALGLSDGPQLPERAWRYQPPLRIPRALDESATMNPAAGGSLAELSRSVETLWWGGIRVDPSEQQKRLLFAPLPDYPEAARRAGIDGPVTLLVRIGPDGAVREAERLSGPPVLGRAAVEAVEQWRYSPLRLGGRAQSLITSVTLAFRLR